MCSPARSFFLGTLALFFHFCTFPSVLAPVPLVQRQLNLESQWARDLPGVIDGLEIENGGGNEQYLADTNLVCCTVTESLIEKTFATCEGGMSFSCLSLFLFFLFFFIPLSFGRTLKPFYPSTLTYAFLVWYVLYWESIEKGQNPPRIQNLTMGFNPSLTVTSETICDGTLYECSVHANNLDTVSKQDLIVPMYINPPNPRASNHLLSYPEIQVC